MPALHELLTLAGRILANYTQAPRIAQVRVNPHGLDGPEIAAQMRGGVGDVAADLLDLACWAELLDQPLVLVDHSSYVGISVTAEVGVVHPGEASFRVWDHLNPVIAQELLDNIGLRWQVDTPQARPRAVFSVRQLREAVAAWTAERTEAA